MAEPGWQRFIGQAPCTKGTGAFNRSLMSARMRNSAMLYYRSSAVGVAAPCLKSWPPKFVPIQFEFHRKKRTARVTVPCFLETTSEPLKVPATGNEQYAEIAVANEVAVFRAPGGTAAVLPARGFPTVRLRNSLGLPLLPFQSGIFPHRVSS